MRQPLDRVTDHVDVGDRARPRRGSGPRAHAVGPPPRPARRPPPAARPRRRAPPGRSRSRRRAGRRGRRWGTGGRHRAPLRTSSTPTPAGPPHLWADAQRPPSRRAGPPAPPPRRRRRRAGTSRSAASAAASAIGCRVPTSGFATCTATTPAGSRSASASASSRTRPCGSTATDVVVPPRCRSHQAPAAITAECSTAVCTNRSLTRRRPSSRPSTPRCTAVVPDEVKETSSARTPSSEASTSRALSSSSRASRPRRCSRAGRRTPASRAASRVSRAAGCSGSVDAESRSTAGATEGSTGVLRGGSRRRGHAPKVPPFDRRTFPSAAYRRNRGVPVVTFCLTAVPRSPPGGCTERLTPCVCTSRSTRAGWSPWPPSRPGCCSWAVAPPRRTTRSSGWGSPQGVTDRTPPHPRALDGVLARRDPRRDPGVGAHRLRCVKFRRRRDDEVPVQTRYNLPIEILYTVAPLIMVLVLFFFTVTAQDKVLASPRTGPHRDRRRPAVVVDVQLRQGRRPRRLHDGLRLAGPRPTSRRCTSR